MNDETALNYTIGLETHQGVFLPLLTSGSSYPVSNKVRCVTSDAFFYVHLFIGDNLKSCHNRFLDKVKITVPDSDELERIELLFRVDSDETLQIHTRIHGMEKCVANIVIPASFDDDCLKKNAESDDDCHFMRLATLKNQAEMMLADCQRLMCTVDEGSDIVATAMGNIQQMLTQLEQAVAEENVDHLSSLLKKIEDYTFYLHISSSLHTNKSSKSLQISSEKNPVE